MPKPLYLFIRPPYDQWQEIYGFGGDHRHTLLRTSGSADLVAAAAGRLSVRWPGVSGFHPSEGVAPPDPTPDYEDPFSELPPPDPAGPLPETVDLYLHPSLSAIVNPSFRARSRELNNIIGFAYLNVETASLEGHLAELLDGAVLDAPDMPRDQVVALLVRSHLDVYVTAGHQIGKGGRAFSEDAPASACEVGFAVITGYGRLDASHVYDWMREFVEDGQPNVDGYLARAPKRWPLIDETLGTDQAIALTQSALYPMTTLERLRTIRNLSYEQWRQVGNNQKALWRKRLLARVGRAPAGSDDPPFEFDDEDWQNIFQLEAVAEFYVNFDNPWAPGAAPRNPGEDGYIPANFLVPFGTAATAVGSTVTFDGPADLLKEVQQDYDAQFGHRQLYGRTYDTLSLENDTTRPGGLYLITEVNMDNIPPPHIVTTEGEPALPSPSAWHINLRPILVLIDSFGGREQLHGSNAQVIFSSPPDNLAKLQLDQTTPENVLRKVNTPFDTIYLPSDTVPISQAHPIARTYRIIDVDAANRTVNVNGIPALEGGHSAWHIPAGISGKMPPMNYNLGYSSDKGWDQYDGAMFIIYGGMVRAQYRWSSYTSRDHLYEVHNGLPHAFVSSLRGNRRYRFRSLRANSSEYINNAFWVNNFVPPNQPVEPVEARYYFEDPVTPDVGGRYTPRRRGQNPAVDAPGKAGIMIHSGGTGRPRPDGSLAQGAGNHSAGCLVSGIFEQFRDKLIDLYQEEYRGLHSRPRNIGPVLDLDVARLRGRNHARSEVFYQSGELSGTKWKDKIVGTLWLIRPDERPLG